MLRHARHRFRNLTARTPQPRALEQNDLSSRRKWVGNGRVPIVECPGEMLKEQQGEPGAVSKAPICVLSVFGLKEFSWTTYVAGGLYVRHFIVLLNLRS